jgi:hypothetical protein
MTSWSPTANASARSTSSPNEELKVEPRPTRARRQPHRTGRTDRSGHRLRGSIGNLNREGRERLRAAFEAVNTHFQRLFTKLFRADRRTSR